MADFQFHTSAADSKIWLRVVARNGEVIHASEKGFATQDEALARARANRDRLLEERAEYYLDLESNFRWRLSPTKDHPWTVGSHEGFASSDGCKNNFALVRSEYKMRFLGVPT